MVTPGQKCSKTVKNGVKQMVKKLSKFIKNCKQQSKTDNKVKIGQNKKRTKAVKKTVNYSQKWSKLVKTGQKQSKTVKTVKNGQQG